MILKNIPNREVLEQIKQKYREVLPEYDAIIFSDYGKGGLSHISDMIDWAKHAGKTVLIDPQRRRLRKIRRRHADYAQ